MLIPAYHEGERVGRVIGDIRAQALPLDIVVIDDGSTDDTAQQAAAHGANVLRHPFNLGYGAALHTGYLHARRSGYARVLQMDADGQHDAGCLPTLLGALDEGADVVLGSRYRNGKPPRTTWSRRLGTWLFASIATRWTGTRITDPTSGFQGLSARALAAVAHDGYPEDYPDTDVLVEFARQGLRIVEVPVVMHERLGGISMHRGARILYYVYKMLLTLALLPVRRTTPFRARDSVARLS